MNCYNVLENLRDTVAFLHGKHRKTQEKFRARMLFQAPNDNPPNLPEANVASSKFSIYNACSPRSDWIAVCGLSTQCGAFSFNTSATIASWRSLGNSCQLQRFCFISISFQVHLHRKQLVQLQNTRGSYFNVRDIAENRPIGCSHFTPAPHSFIFHSTTLFL